MVVFVVDMIHLRNIIWFFDSFLKGAGTNKESQSKFFSCITKHVFGGLLGRNNNRAEWYFLPYNQSL